MEINNDGYSHVALPFDLIERLENVNNWDDWPCSWTVDEEQMWWIGVIAQFWLRMSLSKGESGEKCVVNAHISLPQDLIERLKNEKNWEEWPCKWTFDEERINSVWLWSRYMDDNGDVIVEQKNEQSTSKRSN
ncbi:hypothetical protein BUALT_Bualt06G0004200 [Buddleja alternifolia]|uniref:Uncharacterized protein n=1 Tax=Buddleja alternifolia TaxID=168488 RepID=A0AAV6XCZ1_9LAMI|nr:hypothetical protein BUALT_Bualt06G0004200 [Buddleja alternifolia]